MATVITIIKYKRTVNTIINNDPKTFIVQATESMLTDFDSLQFLLRAGNLINILFT